MIKVNLLALLTAMANACMSVEELSEKVGCCRTMIYNIKRGKLTRPETVGKIAKALGVDAKDLIEDVVMGYKMRK